MVDTGRRHRIIVKVETQLLAHGGEFAGFAAEHGYQLLRGHRFDSTTAFLEFSEYEIELGIEFFFKSGTSSLRAPAFTSWSMILRPLTPPSCWQITTLEPFGSAACLVYVTRASASFSSAFCRLTSLTTATSESNDGLTASSAYWSADVASSSMSSASGSTLVRTVPWCARRSNTSRLRHHGYRYVRCCFRHAPISPHRLDNDLPA